MFFDCRNRYTSLDNAQAWDELRSQFEPMLVLRGSSYNPFRLFKVKPSEIRDKPDTSLSVRDRIDVLSPEGGFRYTEVVLPRGEMLRTIQGNRRGRVAFDADIIIPRINAADRNGGFKRDPWMSITPMEAFTQRGGLRRAKGHVVIAGLGMGWLLEHVARRKQVSQVTLVEVSQELLDWVLPRLDLGNMALDVICGDARIEVPKLDADVALADIWMGYGGNTFPSCPNIPYVWCWGSQFAE